MGRKRKQRRQPHGSAWHGRQTDCWYYTVPGTKKRVPLFDEDGRRIRGKANKEAAELALAKEKLSWGEPFVELLQSSGVIHAANRVSPIIANHTLILHVVVGRGKWIAR